MSISLNARCSLPGTLSFVDAGRVFCVSIGHFPNWRWAPMFQAIAQVTRAMLEAIRWFAIMVGVFILSVALASVLGLFLDWPPELLLLTAFICCVMHIACRSWLPQTGRRSRSSIGNSRSTASAAVSGHFAGGSGGGC